MNWTFAGLSPWQAILCLSVFLLLIPGIYLPCADALGIPTLKSSLALRRAGKQKSGKTGFVSVWIGGLSDRIAKLIVRMQSDAVKEKLSSDLRAGNDGRSNEKYLSDCVSSALPLSLLFFPCLLVAPVFSPFVLLCALLYGFRVYRSAGRKTDRKKEEIEREMHSFVSRISASLKHGRNVLNVLDGCREYAGDALKKELDVAVSEMRTGNDEKALAKLETRACSPLMTEAVRGLRAVLRGDDTSAYWVLLQEKCAESEKQRMKREANRIPRKVKKLSLVLLLCFLFTYLAVIGVQLADSLGVLFG